MSSTTPGVLYDRPASTALGVSGADLNDSRRQYVHRYCASLGFDSSTLSDPELGVFFRALARVDEHEALRASNSRGREQRFLCSSRTESEISSVDALSRRIESPFPFIDLKLKVLAVEGKIKHLEKAPPLWPDSKRFALVLTHDVDSVPGVRLKPRLRGLGAIPHAPAKRKLWLMLSAGKGLTQSLVPRRQNPEGSFESWLDEEAQYGFRSSFFFFSGYPPVRNWRDAFYRQYDEVAFEGRKRPVSSVMKILAERGWDVGLHGSSLSWRDPELLRKERESVEVAIGRAVRTTRQHHLLFDPRYTPSFQRQAGFEADTTLGSNTTVGFRCGTCFPFNIYDLNADRDLDLLEVPLIIQEAPLFRQHGQDEFRAYERCRELMKLVASLNGCLTLLWHNYWARTSPQFRVYSAVLAEAQRLGAWGCSLVQLNDWWRRRSAAVL